MAPEIGEALREARIRRGIALKEVEQSTKIRAKFLRAMEEDQWELLPEAAYARGFLRTYATFLSLDGAALVQEYSRRHERVDEGYPPGEPLLLNTPGPAKPRLRLSGAVLAGLAVAALLGVGVVLGLTGGSGGGGGHRAGGAPRGSGGPQGGEALPSTGQGAPQASEVSLQLTPTGTIWVCLVDDRGRALVNGLTLATGAARGPFRARVFKGTFGNGEIQMEVDGKSVKVPQVAEPLGYRITRQGVRQLDPADRPTCG
jgi:helix-turn-helix protein